MNIESDKILIVVNPASDKGKTSRIIPKIQSIIDSSEINAELLTTTNKNHALEFIAEHGARFNRIIIGGGDGTINEVVNGLDLSQNIKIGIIPSGSGNDFSSNFKNPASIEDFFRELINENYSTRNVDIAVVKLTNSDGSVVKRKFINSMGIGFDAFVALEYQKIKRLKGNLAYLAAVIKGLRKLEYLNANLYVENRNIKGQYVLLSIGNGARSGGGFYLNPGAVIDDGLLNFSLLNRMSKPKIMKSLPKALLNKAETIPELELLKFKTCRIEIEPEYVVHCDGEIIGTNVISAEISICHEEIKIIEF